MDLTKAARDVLAERAAHRTRENFTEAHDDKHRFGELARAAASYAYFGSLIDFDRALFTRRPRFNHVVQILWVWSWNWWKPKDRRYDLVRAGALILAEIERLDRAEARKGDAPWSAPSSS